MAQRWDLMTSAEIGALVASGFDLALLPVGATEQHGPHLATGCDTISPEEIAVSVAAEMIAVRRNAESDWRALSKSVFAGEASRKLLK